MPTPSLAEGVLSMIERSTGLVHELYILGDHKGAAPFRDLIHEFEKLEAFALRRADASATEAHRRAMEACHIMLPKQAQHG